MKLNELYNQVANPIDDPKVIYNNILNDLNNSFNEDILKLYYIIKLSIIK